MGNHLATIDISQKVGAAVPLSMGGAGSPSNTMSPGPPTSVHLDPSNLLVTIYQRYRQTGQTDRQDDNRPKTDGGNLERIGIIRVNI